MSEEIFKDIENYEGLYQVSSYGRVYSLISKKFLKFGKMNNDYLTVTLYKDGKGKNYSVHRLVANAFIPNPLHLPQVNHISEDKTENHVSNLEWCNAKYNSNYGTRTQRVTEKLSKAVLQFTKDNKFLAEYPSTMEASRRTRITQQNISACCRGIYKSARGYVWRYKDVS